MAYVIGSQKGKDIAKNMKMNESWTNPADGSTWTKQKDGSVSVKTSKGETFNNAYTPTSSGSSKGGSSGSSYSGSSGGGNSQYTQGNYSIGSYDGQQIAQNLAVGGWTVVSDGSRWEKEPDGTVTVYHNGTKTKNAWTPNYYNSYQTAKNVVNDYTNLNPQPEYQNQYDPRIDALLNEILNRDDFSYDVTNDPLYQQYSQMYQREGDRAMRNTLAEAAASAGGMNTYAMTAAMQANNYYNSQLTDKIPELYQLAYEMYLNDKESKIQDLNILQDMSDTQYNRYKDTLDNWYNDKNFAYGMYQDAVNQGNLQAQQDYNSNWDKIKWDYQVEQDKIINDRYDAETSYNKEIYNKETAEARVRELIETYGELPDDDMLEQADWDKAYAIQLVNARRRELGLPPIGSTSSTVTYSSGGTGGSSKVSSGNKSGNVSVTGNETKKVNDSGNGGAGSTPENTSPYTFSGLIDSVANFKTVGERRSAEDVCKELAETQGKDAVINYLKEIKAAKVIDHIQYTILVNRYGK